MSATATARRRIRLRPVPVRLTARRMRLLVAIAALVILAGLGGWLLVRDSSFVAVDHVTVTGVSGPETGAITATLDAAARRMTTLDVSTARLNAAVSRFPEVKGLRVSTRFPHTLVIHVIELLPVAVVRAPGREVVLTSDGTLLPHAPIRGSLPVITLPEPPSGGTLTQPWARAAAALLAAAPSRLLARISAVTTIAGHGLVAQIRNGPSIYFGSGDAAVAKWAAAVAVLADPGSAGASYIDVTDPARPAAGTSGTAAGSTGTGAGTTAATTGSTAASTQTTSPAVQTTTAPSVQTTPSGG